MTRNRIVWDAHTKQWLAKQVARAMIRDGHDLNAKLVPYLDYLRDAVQWLPEADRREVISVSQTPWLVPMMREMLAAQSGQSSKYPSTILDAPAAPTATQETFNFEGAPAIPDPVIDDQDEYSIPPGFALVPQDAWTKINRSIRLNHKQIASLADTVETLTALLLEAAPHLAPAEIKPDAQLPREPIPLIVVAGLRERDYSHVLAKVTADCEIVFLNARTQPPEQAGECDWLITTRMSGDQWIKRALKLYKGRTSVVNSLTGVIREVERIRGHGV